MAFEPTIVESGLTAAQRKANQRARDKGKPEPFVRVSPEELAQKKDQYDLDLAYAKEQDATGTYYKSECRPLTDLLAVYYGADLNAKETDEDEETSKSKKPKKKTNQPNPSKDIITIKAVWGPNGEPIEPSCWVGCDHTTCGKGFRKTFEVKEVVSFRRWLDLRDKARKNLFWLCRLLTKTPFHSVHQYVCDQYIKKNFDGLWFPGYDLEDFKEAFRAQLKYRLATYPPESAAETTNELLLLEQRGGYKSTIDGADCVQWLINAPDMRIMVLTAFRQLAKKRAKEIKAYFFLPERGNPSSFHLLFPEFITRGVMGRSDGPLESPARVNANFFKEDSMWFTSMESSATGDHCDVLKADDIVDPDNSADEEMREELKNDFDSRKTDQLDGWGFLDITGTRYFTDDMYGERFKVNPESKRCSPFRYSCRGAFTMTPEDYILYSLPPNDPARLTIRQALEEERGILTFPAKNNWAKLRNLYDEKGERGFKNQQMNEATDKSELADYVNHFDHDVLIAHTYPKESVPPFLKIFILWDLAYSQSSTSDFSVGVVVGIGEAKDNLQQVVVLDAVYGKWKSSELATQMALFSKKWPESQGCLIEKINGVEWLMSEVKNAAAYYGIFDMKIALVEIDNSRSAKRNRIRNLEILLFDNRLHFVSSALWNDECFKQFTIFTGEPSTRTRKDDFPDAISFVFKLLRRDAVRGGSDDPEKTRKEREERHRKELMQWQHERMHGGLLGGTLKNPGPPSPQGPTARTFGKNPTSPPAPEPSRPMSPREQMLAQMMKILPSGLRRRGQ